ncbi:MAG TPA: MG2 domain-containing protein, partial [Blastocatellia bacterium]|nr:MG2 domain-containing protein [Blastocatellia bacterium]
MFRLSPRRVFIALFLATLTITIFSKSFFAAQQVLIINESATRANFDDEKPRVLFAIENRSYQPVAAHIRLELINPHDHVYFRSERDETIKPGASTLDFSLNRTAVNPDQSLDELLWYRLRYTVTYSQSSNNQPLSTVNGIISVSEITPEIFELQVFVPGMAKANAELQARARTLHPITGKPVSGVKIEGVMETDDEDHPLKVSGVTDAMGYATLIFKTPKEYDEDQLPIKFTATRGQIKQEAEAEDINFDSFKRILLHTDKPLYQPGQTLHIRALLFDQNNKALANAEAELTITDPENAKVFRAELKTSRFGVASADWQIPD